MPEQKTATALCVSKIYKNDDVVAGSEMTF